MNETENSNGSGRDPLGLGALPMLTPETDGWPNIERALKSSGRARRLRQSGAWLAAAASVVLLVTVVIQQPLPVQPDVGPDSLATEIAAVASDDHERRIESLIAMSQTLEQQLRGIREESGSMPAQAAVYVAELEDLVAQVDNRLSYAPDSVNLWGQRVNLLLDLAQIYQHQWERDYGRMASL